jgi:hypothetical protein
MAGTVRQAESAVASASAGRTSFMAEYPQDSENGRGKGGIVSVARTRPWGELLDMRALDDQEGSASFLKKRSKRLLIIRGWGCKNVRARVWQRDDTLHKTRRRQSHSRKYFANEPYGVSSEKSCFLT